MPRINRSRSVKIKWGQVNSTRFVGQVVGLSGSRRGVPTTGSEGTGESSIYRYACFRSQRMATAPQIGGR